MVPVVSCLWICRSSWLSPEGWWSRWTSGLILHESYLFITVNAILVPKPWVIFLHGGKHCYSILFHHSLKWGNLRLVSANNSHSGEMGYLAIVGAVKPLASSVFFSPPTHAMLCSNFMLLVPSRSVTPNLTLLLPGEKCPLWFLSAVPSAACPRTELRHRPPTEAMTVTLNSAAHSGQHEVQLRREFGRCELAIHPAFHTDSIPHVQCNHPDGIFFCPIETNASYQLTPWAVGIIWRISWGPSQDIPPKF